MRPAAKVIEVSAHWGNLRHEILSKYMCVVLCHACLVQESLLWGNSWKCIPPTKPWWGVAYHLVKWKPPFFPAYSKNTFPLLAGHIPLQYKQPHIGLWLGHGWHYTKGSNRLLGLYELCSGSTRMVQQQSILNYISSFPNVFLCESLYCVLLSFMAVVLSSAICASFQVGLELSMCVLHTQRNSGETVNKVKHWSWCRQQPRRVIYKCNPCKPDSKWWKILLERVWFAAQQNKWYNIILNHRRFSVITHHIAQLSFPHRLRSG